MSSPVLDPRDPAPALRERLRAWLALQHVGFLSPARAASALARAGDPRAAARRLEAAETPLPARRRLDAGLARMAAVGAVAVPLDSPAYPDRIRRLRDPAPLLWVRGRPDALRHPAVAVVGARAATRAGRETARSLAGDLARLGLGVVSGLARGVDGAAHRGALDAGGVTLAVLGCGADVSYPPEHAGLLEAVAATGAVVSELPPGAPPRALHFPLRNRLISGLASVLVVVEARERSGSLGTVAHALEQGVEVMAVPGPVHTSSHRGSNGLLRDGAAPVLEVDDVLRALGLPPAGARPGRVAGGPLLESLRREPASCDELARRLGRAAEEVGAELVRLELAGRVLRERDGRWIAS